MQKYSTTDEFLDDLSDDKRAIVNVLRDLILNTEPRLEEHLKWNAPSYALDGDDRITFNLMNKQGVVKLVLHMGATVKEDKMALPIIVNDSGLVEWVSDIRGMITLGSMNEVTAQQKNLKNLIKEWLSIPVRR